FRFIKVKEALEEAEGTLKSMESEVEEIRQGLTDLKESEVRNSEAVQQALDAYETISESVTSDPDKYGVSYKELEKQIQNVERDFTQFVALNTAGDPMEARTVLEKAEKRTYEIQEVIEQIPPLFEVLNKVFPKQLKEIKEGYASLIKDHYVFENDIIQTNVDKLEGKVRSTLMNLEKLEVENVGKLNSEIAKEIDQLYDIMEKEINARHYVNDNKSTLVNYLEHADKNNHLLLIELDHVSQSYVLNNNELGKVRGFQAQMQEMQKEFDATEEKLKNKEAIFSQVAAFYRESLDQLKDIEEDQIETGQSIKDFAPRERDAIKKIDDYELELRTLKRHVEKQRLPGIPSSYLEFFYVAGERVEELSRELNKIRIDMNHIDRLVGLCEEDIQTLKDKTNNLIDSAALTEQMIQHANRYRFSHPEIKNAIDRSLSLFSREHLYEDALDTISAGIERIEPGTTERIRKYYFENKNNQI
ncbi:MAG: septation ring formation regulator EzrA, partial [Vagococcus sp.]